MRKNVVVDRLKSNKGFMLAEVTLAMLIISVALVPIASMFTQAIQADMMAHHYTVAANLAQKQLELLKTQPPEYWATCSPPCSIPWQDSTQPVPSRYTILTTGVATHHDSLVEVRVMVSWRERGLENKLQFVTLYSAL